MSKLDPFTAQIIHYVRSMPDDALLELVRAHLGSGIGELSGRGGNEGTKNARASAPAKPKAAASAAPATPAAAASRKPATKAKAKPKAKRPKQAAARSSAAERAQLLDSVEKVVKSNKGLSASEVAEKVKVVQTRVATALRELKKSKRIYQGGDRRFARYAGDSKTAKQASEKARQNAPGPQRS